MTTGTGFEPSPYQQAIFQWVQNGRGSAIVEAVAGSGKTTTMIEALSLMRGRVLFCAFNKHISEELGAKLKSRGLGHVHVSTIHSLGFAAVRYAARGARLEVDNSKMQKILRGLLGEAEWKREETLGLRTAALRLADLARLTLSDTSREALEGLAERYDVDLNGSIDRVAELVPQMIEQGKANRACIDFTDMVYLPVALNLRPRRYDWVCVDEAQDLNAAQRELVLRAAAGGRVMAVGDSRQAIYGFSGADTTSINTLRDRVSAAVLPLSICYRCPSSHLDLARAIVPAIEDRPGAPQGEIQHMSREKATEILSDDDLVVCRVNAPLASIAMDLIRRGRKVTIRGRDISGQLMTLMDKHAGRGVGIEDALRLLTSYRDREVSKLEKAEKFTRAEALRDKVETILALSDGCRTVAELRRRIENVFSDDVAGVVLSSVHRAKGLEAPRVFVYREELMPFPRASRDWEIEQEWNLKYVSLTRAKKALYFVSK